MPGRSWLADLRSRLGGGARADGLGILAFEAAAAMSRLVSLHLALYDAEVRRLRGDALRAEGVARLTSTDQAILLRLACAELVADLDRAADAAARLGARCGAGDGAPLLRDFDKVYADAKRGRLAQLDAAVGYSRGAARRFREMERHVAATARLYAEMDALGELEASERRMEQWMRHSGPIPARSTPGKGPAAAAADAASRHSAPIFRQNDAAASSPLAPIKPSASTVGGAGMELRYANVILSAETLLAALRPAATAAGDSDEVPVGMIDLSRRDGLYKMLPVSIREAVNAKLRETWRGQPAAVCEEAAAAARGSVEGVLRWLGPVAHDTVRWHDERSMERAQRFSMRPRALMAQTLHFADQQKVDDAIVEVLLGLSCVCWYDEERRRLESLDWDDE